MYVWQSISRGSEPDTDSDWTALSDWDILFADDEREANPATFKFIQNALAWRVKEGGGGMDLSAALLAQDDDEDDEEDAEGEGDGEGEDDDERSSNEGGRGDRLHVADSDDERSSNGMQED